MKVKLLMLVSEGQIFPLVNFVISHYGHSGGGGGSNTIAKKNILGKLLSGG